VTPHLGGMKVKITLDGCSGEPILSIQSYFMEINVLTIYLICLACKHSCSPFFYSTRLFRYRITSTRTKCDSWCRRPGPRLSFTNSFTAAAHDYWGS